MNEKYKHMLETAISELPLKDRFIMKLHVAGETEEMIGRAFHVSHQAISSRLRRITTKLAEKCSQLDGERLNDH